MRYIYDFGDTAINVDGYEKIGEKVVASGIRGDVIFIIKQTKVFGKAYKYIKKSMETSGSTRVIFVGEIENEYKQICMLMMTYKNYNVYNVEEIAEIDEEYLDVICERECTADEIETFFGPEMAVYPEMADILNMVADYIKAGDMDGLISYLSRNTDKILSMSGLIKFIQSVIDELSMNSENRALTDESELKKHVDKLRSELSRAKSEYDVLNRQSFEKSNTITAQENEIEQLKAKLEELSLTKSASKLVTAYTTLSLDKFVSTSVASSKTPKIREVIYFKELNPCRFINTFVTLLNTVLSVINGVNTKLLIYDNKSFHNIKYKPLKVVDLETYVKDKDTALAKLDKMVVVEPGRFILEDTLMEKECVIIYDRLGKQDDIVSGRHVHKFYVVNSIKDIHVLESQNDFDMTKVITNVGVSKKCISIREIKEFKSMTMNGRISAYINMTNIGDDIRPVFDILMERTGVSKLLKR